MNSKIWLSSPHFCGKEIQFVQEAIDQNFVSSIGAHVQNLENDIQQYLTYKPPLTATNKKQDSNVAVVNSGTAALHLGLILLGVKPGDEVICQSMTFSASANPIMYQNAVPVFVDSEKDTWNMCPQQLEAAIKDRMAKGKKPKAIIPVHLYGMPAKMDEILAIASRYEIPVLEDAAEALGSHLNGKMCGTFGTLGALSFNGNKIITTSGGGALVCQSPEDKNKAVFLSTQARDAAPHYQHSEVGYNYRMSNIAAGIGRGQMDVLKDRVQQRRAHYEKYFKAFSATPGVSFLPEPKGFFSNRWLTTVLIDPAKTGGVTREDLRLALEKENIESRPLWKPMHLQPVFAACPFYGEGIAEKLFEQGLCLPSGSNLTEQEFERIFTAMRKVFSV